jgi:hypothetical protein
MSNPHNNINPSISNPQNNVTASIKGTLQLPQMVRVEYDNGTSVEVSSDFEVTERLIDDVGDIISTVCKIFPKLCGGGGGGGGGSGSGCYKIIGPDGTEITICPPPKLSPA